MGHIGDNLYGSDDPTNIVKALKDNSLLISTISIYQTG